MDIITQHVLGRDLKARKCVWVSRKETVDKARKTYLAIAAVEDEGVEKGCVCVCA